MKKNLLLFIILFFGGGSFFSYGQDRSFHTVSVEDGLSNNFIRKIYKDNRGFIWLGTLKGLDRFDGISFKSYIHSKDQEGNVFDLIETNTNSLWIATNNGLWELNFDNEKLTQTPFSGGKQFLCLNKDEDNRLLAGTTNGLYIVSGKDVQYISLSQQLPQGYTVIVQGIYPDANRTCWLATSQGLFFCDYSSGEPQIAHYSYDKINNFSSIQKDGPNIYIGTKGHGIIRFDILSKQFSRYIHIGNDLILFLSRDKNNHLWAGTDGRGLIKISTSRDMVLESFLHYNQDKNSIASNAVYSFLEDDQILWVGTYSTGLSYSINKTFKTYSYKNFSSQNLHVRSLYVRDKERFIGTRDGFVYINEDKEIIESFISGKTNSLHLSSNTIFNIFPYKGKFLLGTLQGLRVFNPEDLSIKPFHENPVFETGNFYDFTEDSNKNLWIASFKGVIRVSASGEVVQFTQENSGLINNTIHSIRKDNRNRIWIGTKSGVCYYDPAQDIFRKAEVLPSSIDICKITNIYTDRNADIWFCTETNGLYRINSDLTSCEHYTTDDFLPDNAVSSIMEDGLGYFWVATHKGLMRCTFADDKCHTYWLSDGLPGLMFNPGACYYDPENKRFWWGNEKGLIYCDIEDIRNRNTPPPVHIIRFYINGKEITTNTKHLPKAIDRTSEIRLSRFENSFGFDFVALNYLYPNDNTFETRLDGLDSEWNMLPKGETSVYYGDIPPGKYTFRIRLAGYPETEKNLTIIIKHSWTTLAWLIPTLLLCFVLFFFGYKFRQSILRQKRKVSGHKKEIRPEATGKDYSLQHQALLRLMEEKKPYLEPELKMSHLTAELKCSSKELSELFRDSIKQSFADFINSYRVHAFKERIKKGEHEKFTILALSEQCGFSSRSSFFRIFKKITGVTPLEYLKQVENGEQ